MKDHYAEFLRQQTLTIVSSCGRCQSIRCEAPERFRTKCDRCGRRADQAAFAVQDGQVLWEHEHLCDRCMVRGREAFGGIPVGPPEGVPRLVRGDRGRKAGGRHRGPRASRPPRGPSEDR